MGKYSSGKAMLQGLLVKQDGKVITDHPKAGAYTLAVKPDQTFYGDPGYVLNVLTADFPGCTFSWESDD